MQESKEIGWASNYDDESTMDASPAEPEQAANDSVADNSPQDPDGWQQYRKWISTAPAPRKRRSGVDPSLYTWKGYRSWTEQVKRKWSDS